VYVTGDVKDNKPFMVTYADFGLNNTSGFKRFFNTVKQEKKSLLNDFTIIGLNAPGQHYEAEDIDPELTEQNPMSIESLVTQMEEILTYFGVGNFLGFGIGAGAFIIEQYLTKHPNQASALVLLGATSRRLGWIEWGKSLMGYYLNEKMFVNMFVERWFGWNAEGNSDLMDFYKEEIFKMNRRNLDLFVTAYHSRVDITGSLSKVSCPIMLAFGDLTYHEDEATHFRTQTKIDRTKMVWLRIEGTGMLITEHKPYALLKPINLMLNGLGFYRKHNGVTKAAF
jgi:pimeloyl-ACP methyl ester carboxylesterase